jgi:hypothetical protein
MHHEGRPDRVFHKKIILSILSQNGQIQTDLSQVVIADLRMLPVGL